MQLLYKAKILKQTDKELLVLREANNFYKFDKDEKDPLNRFGGFFNNRSFGNGKFVLVNWRGQEWEDSVYVSKMGNYPLTS